MSQRIRNARVEKLEKEFHKMLKYPHKDPPASHMLVKYTIWKDIEVFSTFIDKINKTPELLGKIKQGKEQVPRSLIHNHQINVYISLALEVENRLKSIYVWT